MDLRRVLRLLLGSRLPITSGSLRLNGIGAPITVRRDRFGIAYIDAENDDDAWFGLGFCQAQDRAFQLELRLRTVRGTLSALVGEPTLAIDRLARRVGFRESAERQLPALDADIRAQIDAFVRGINAGLSAGIRRRPPEFVLLRSEPSRWEPADVLGIGKLMSFMLIGNWDVELSRLKILREDGPQALRDLDPAYPEDHPVVSPPGGLAGHAIDRLSADLEEFLSFAGTATGSNAWAIGGSRTASGRPILASDPHLEATLPPHWYLASVRTPEWGVAGAALIGSPAVAIGHNGFAAWGITASLVDTVDLFIEEVGADGRSVRRGAAFEPCLVRREVIEVKKKAPVIEDVLVGSHGPIVGPAFEGDIGAIAMRASWLDAKPARGFLSSPRARSFQSFRREFEAWPALNQNVVYADETGAIAWQLIGEAPRRRKGWGTLPQSGADLDAGWLDEGVPFAEMPYVLDPPAGFVATANNKPVADDGGPYLGVDWLDGYRAARITEAVAARNDWDVEATQRLQLDRASLTWREVQDIVLGLPETSDDTRIALDLLRGWDGAVTAASSAASLFILFVAEMRRRIARSRAPKSYQWALGKGFASLLPVTTFTAGRSSSVLRALRGQPSGWFTRPWPEEMADTLAAVVRDLRSRHGQEAASWAWGKIRPLTLEHPLGRIRQLAPVFNRGPIAWGGESNTVSPNGSVIASMRMVVEAGNWDEARFSLPGGQSGNPFSAHYDDLLTYWLQGEGVPIAWSPAAVAAAARATLQLLPLA
jgi:penicillin amidase